MSPFETKRHLEAFGQIRFGQHIVKRAGSEHLAFAKHQNICEPFWNFLDVMGDEHCCWSVDSRSENTQGTNEVLASSEVEPCSGLIEKKKTRLGHQGSGQ
jgi:hypothetical protein